MTSGYAKAMYHYVSMFQCCSVSVFQVLEGNVSREVSKSATGLEDDGHSLELHAIIQ